MATIWWESKISWEFPKGTGMSVYHAAESHREQAAHITQGNPAPGVNRHRDSHPGEYRGPPLSFIVHCIGIVSVRSLGRISRLQQTSWWQGLIPSLLCACRVGSIHGRSR